MNEESYQYRTKKPSIVFYCSAVIVSLFVLWGAITPSSLYEATAEALDWMIHHFGWFYMLVTLSFVVFVIGLAAGPYGRLKLGKPDDLPEYTWFSWIGMLFAAGVGVGFVFWGVAEPLLYFGDPPPIGVEANTTEAALASLRYSVFHWALHPWAIFSIIGLTLAYVQYKKDQPALISSAFYPLIGEKANGKTGQAINFLAVITTAIGVATTFGLSALQISGGLSYLTNIPNNATTQMVIIGIVTILFMISAARGVNKGIKILSNTNLVVAVLLFTFVIVVGPTIFILENTVTTLGGYVSNLIPMSLTLTPFSDSDWLGRNTIFFWAWHVSWAPFVGLFIARISRGRTIREFIAGVLVVPSLVAILWFSVFGGTALNIEMIQSGGIAELVNNEVEVALFAMLAELPLHTVTSTLAVLLVIIFFITSADSASYVLGVMSSKGSLSPKRWVKFVWGILIAGTASVLLLSGEGGLDALQTASIVVALPFTVIMILMIISVLFMFSNDLYVQGRQEKKENNTKE
nr:BCCT family transporter [Natronobacillus azotifigens]